MPNRAINSRSNRNEARPFCFTTCYPMEIMMIFRNMLPCRSLRAKSGSLICTYTSQRCYLFEVVPFKLLLVSLTSANLLIFFSLFPLAGYGKSFLTLCELHLGLTWVSAVCGTLHGFRSALTVVSVI